MAPFSPPPTRCDPSCRRLTGIRRQQHDRECPARFRKLCTPVCLISTGAHAAYPSNAADEENRVIVSASRMCRMEWKRVNYATGCQMEMTSHSQLSAPRTSGGNCRHATFAWVRSVCNGIAFKPRGKRRLHVTTTDSWHDLLVAPSLSTVKNSHLYVIC